jgi:hypothetical protein
VLRYQLVANATYLSKGHLVAGATYLRLRLRFAKPRLRLRLRYQLIAKATYLAKPRFSTPFQHDSMMLPAGLGLALR